MIKKAVQAVRNRWRRKQIYRTARFWDQKAESLAGHAVSMWPNNHLNDLYQEEQIAAIAQTLPDLRSKRVLDLGCGTGRLTEWLAKRCASVVGIDFSAKALEIAERNRTSQNVEFRLGSVLDLDQEQEYDVVFCWGVLAIAVQDREELSRVLQRIGRALKQDGEVLLLEPIHSGFLKRVLDMDVPTFLGELESSGFVIRDVRAMHFWPARLLLAFFSWPRWVTAPLYRAGQALMRLQFLSRCGDYFAIHADLKARR